MVITMLDGRVKQDSWEKLEEIYTQSVRKLDTGIIQTFLIQGMKDPTTWKIVTIWESREALDAMRHSGETPRGVLMFREVGTEPELTVFEIKGSSK